MIEPAQQMIYGATIHRLDPSFSKADALAVSEGRLLAVGTREEVDRLCGPKTRRIDLTGHTILPGLIDSHLHLVYTGKLSLELNLYGLTKEAILELVKEALTRADQGQWIVGMGWDQTHWTDPQFPHLKDLDALAPDRPVYLQRSCGHCAWFNSRAAQEAGLTKGLADPVGGEYFRDEEGNLTGIVTDQAQKPFYQVIPQDSPEMIAAKTLAAQKGFLAYGLTSVHDMGSPPSTLEVWEQLYEEGLLKLRLFASLKIPGRPDRTELIEKTKAYLKAGPRIGLFDDRLTVRSYKAVMDGSLGARSAWLLEDYHDRPGHRGEPRMEEGAFFDLVKLVHDAGFQLATHAIGDAAVRACLDAYESILPEDHDRRWRIEHAQVIDPLDMSRFSQLGIIPTIQSVFLPTDRRLAWDRLGPHRLDRAYIWRAMVDSGCCPPNGSDSPVEDANPFVNMYCAVARKGPDDDQAWFESQALTRQEALLSYTRWPAYAAFEETLKGSLESGKLADFIVLDRDVMTCDLEDLPDTRVLATVVGGEVVYNPLNLL